LFRVKALKATALKAKALKAKALKAEENANKCLLIFYLSKQFGNQAGLEPGVPTREHGNQKKFCILMKHSG